MKKGIVKFFIIVLLNAPFVVAATATLENGMSELANKIVLKSLARGKESIAISYFLHTNGDQSELSNYLADELVLKIFDVPESNLEIIERSQLNLLFKEMKFNMSGVVDAKTIQKLGRVHGVGALVLGSIAEMGESIRINARLIDTETGRVFSAAGVTIPKTATIKTLLTKVIIRAGGVENKLALVSSPSKEQSQQGIYKVDLSKYSAGDMPEELGMVVVGKGKKIKGGLVLKGFEGGDFKISLPYGGLHGDYEISFTEYNLTEGQNIVKLLSSSKSLSWQFNWPIYLFIGKTRHQIDGYKANKGSNTIRIVASGRVVKLYINDEFIASQIQDPSVVYTDFKISLKRKANEISNIKFTQK